jgi:glycine/D-amino acid oxidase-like deaminating enzyme
MTVSHWQRSRTPQRINADLCIVGGGIAGIAALRLAVLAGIDARLIERHTLGHGASTRNAGYLMRGADDNYAAACDARGRDAARTLWHLSERTSLVLRALGALDETTAAPRPSCLIAADDAEAEQLTRSLAMLREDGFDAEPLTPSRHPDDPLLRAHPNSVGLVNPRDHVCDPKALLRRLAEPVLDRIAEHEEAFAIEPLRSDATTGMHLVRTGAADIECRAVLVCTNAYTRTLLQDGAPPIEPNRAQMLTLDASGLRGGLAFAYYLDRGGDYIRQLDRSTIAIGGQRRFHADEERTLDDAVSDHIQQRLETRAAELLGARLPIVHRWAGTMGFTPDHLPLVGPIAPPSDPPSTPEAPNVHLLAGFTGHGMSLAPAAAEIALHHIARSLGCQNPPPPPGLEPFIGLAPAMTLLRPGRSEPGRGPARPVIAPADAISKPLPADQ